MIHQDSSSEVKELIVPELSNLCKKISEEKLGLESATFQYCIDLITVL